MSLRKKLLQEALREWAGWTIKKVMDGLEIRTVNTMKRMGAEYANGLGSPEALRAMWRSLIENAKEATHRGHVEYAFRRSEVAKAVRGSRRLSEMKTASSPRGE